MKQNGMFERYAVAKTWSARAARELSEGGRPERKLEGDVGDLPRPDGARAWRRFLMREDFGRIDRRLHGGKRNGTAGVRCGCGCRLVAERKDKTAWSKWGNKYMEGMRHE